MGRDYTSMPVSDQLGLGGVIAGLVADLEALRAGQITVPDAMARSMLAKQIFNGVRIYMNGTKYLSDAAVPALSPNAEGVSAGKLAGDRARDEPTMPIRLTPTDTSYSV